MTNGESLFSPATNSRLRSTLRQKRFFSVVTAVWLSRVESSPVSHHSPGCPRFLQLCGMVSDFLFVNQPTEEGYFNHDNRAVPAAMRPVRLIVPQLGNEIPDNAG